MKTTYVAVMLFFPESIILKVLNHSYIQSFLSTITRHPDNGIWKTPYNWRFYGHQCQACTKKFNLSMLLLFLSNKASF